MNLNPALEPRARRLSSRFLKGPDTETDCSSSADALDLPALLLWFNGAAVLFPSLTTNGLIAVSGASVTLAHLAVLLAIAYGIGRANVVRKNGGSAASTVLMATAVAISLMAGVAIHGLTAANAVMIMLLPLSYVWLILALPPDVAAVRVRQFLRWTAWALVLLAIWNAAHHGLGDAYAGAVDPKTGEFVSGRILNAAQASILALTALQAIGDAIYGRAWKGGHALSVACLLALVGAQQRTVWIATAAAIAILFVRSGVVGMRYATAGLWFAALTSPLILWRFGGQLRTSTDISATQGTFGARQSTNSYYWEMYKSDRLEHQIFGHAFGGGYDRIVNGTHESFTPHTFYVLVTHTLGAIGLVLLIAVLARVVSGNSIVLASSQRNALALFFALFFYGYSPPLAVAPAFGLALLRVSPPDRSRIRPTRVASRQPNQLQRD